MDVLIEALLDRFEEEVKASHLGAEADEVMAVARAVAYAHHKKGDKRAYTGEPYIVHPMEVALNVMGVGGTETMVKAALAHDALEHEAMTEDELRDVAGADALEIVVELTDENGSGASGGNRAARKARSRARLAKATAEAKTVKLGDAESNSRSIAVRAPDFARVYVRELHALLEEMKGGSNVLRAKAEANLAEAAKKLGLDLK